MIKTRSAQVLASTGSGCEARRVVGGGALKVDCEWHTGTGEEFERSVVKRDADKGVGIIR